MLGGTEAQLWARNSYRDRNNGRRAGEEVMQATWCFRSSCLMAKQWHGAVFLNALGERSYCREMANAKGFHSD
jgi:hypothetical protein